MPINVLLRGGGCLDSSLRSVELYGLSIHWPQGMDWIPRQDRWKLILRNRFRSFEVGDFFSYYNNWNETKVLGTSVSCGVPASVQPHFVMAAAGVHRTNPKGRKLSLAVLILQALKVVHHGSGLAIQSTEQVVLPAAVLGCAVHAAIEPSVHLREDMGGVQGLHRQADCMRPQPHFSISSRMKMWYGKLNSHGAIVSWTTLGTCTDVACQWAPGASPSRRAAKRSRPWAPSASWAPTLRSCHRRCETTCRDHRRIAAAQSPGCSQSPGWAPCAWSCAWHCAAHRGCPGQGHRSGQLGHHLGAGAVWHPWLAPGSPSSRCTNRAMAEHIRCPPPPEIARAGDVGAHRHQDASWEICRASWWSPGSCSPSLPGPSSSWGSHRPPGPSHACAASGPDSDSSLVDEEKLLF